MTSSYFFLLPIKTNTFYYPKTPSKPANALSWHTEMVYDLAHPSRMPTSALFLEASLQFHIPDCHASKHHEAEYVRNHLVFLVRHWLREVGTRPRLRWIDDRPYVTAIHRTCCRLGVVLHKKGAAGAYPRHMHVQLQLHRCFGRRPRFGQWLVG